METATGTVGREKVGRVAKGMGGGGGGREGIGGGILLTGSSAEALDAVSERYGSIMSKYAMMKNQREEPGVTVIQKCKGTEGSRLQYYSESALEPGAASMSGRVRATMVGYLCLPVKITDPAAECLRTT